MAFDLNSIFDISHLATFLGGTAVGAAGTYMADRFTDRRRAKEVEDAVGDQFRRISKQMPELISEFQKDLRAHPQLFLREFVILSNERISFNHGKPRIEIYESRHSAAKNQVSVLVGEGFVEVVQSSDIPIYRLTETFVERLTRAV